MTVRSMRCSALFALLFMVACQSAESGSQAPGVGAGTGGSGGAGGVAGIGSSGAGGAVAGAGGTSAGGMSGGAAGMMIAPSGGSGGMAGAAGATGGSSGSAGMEAPPSTGCDGTSLLPLPDDPKLRGPWDVGVRTVTIGRLTVEVMYPAEPGSTAGMPEATYDVRDWLPESQRALVPDANSPAVGPIGGHLYRDVPIDPAHGPYPVVVMIHGTSSFRIASGSTNVHWASRGFVVVAADYPGLGLHDQLASTLECGLPVNGEQDIEGDVRAQITALEATSGPLEFLKDRLDMTRLGLAGHSQGACMAALLASLPNVQIVLPFTGSTAVSPSTTLKSIMWIAGMDDTVIGYNTPLIGNVVCPANPLPATSNFDAYTQSAGPPEVKKRLVGITGGGHLVPSDLCQKNAQGRNAIEEANMDMVCGINSAVIIGLPALFDCGMISLESGIEAVNYASTIALEETLHCMDRDAQFEGLRTALPQVGDYQRED